VCRDLLVPGPILEDPGLMLEEPGPLLDNPGPWLFLLEYLPVILRFADVLLDMLPLDVGAMITVSSLLKKSLIIEGSAAQDLRNSIHISRLY
jgi:hypothetical protein